MENEEWLPMLPIRKTQLPYCVPETYTGLYVDYLSTKLEKKEVMWLDKTSIVLEKQFQQLNSDAVFENSIILSL